VDVDEQEWLEATFEQHRPQLRAVAFRMLGSAADADDALQETWLRVSRADTDAVDNMAAWLTTVTARVCLNVLRARRRRREEPFVRLPDPVISDDSGVDPEQASLLADSVGLALLVVLHRRARRPRTTRPARPDRARRLTRRSHACALGCRRGMSTTSAVIVAVVAGWVGFSAYAVLTRRSWVVDNLADYGVARRWWPWLGAVKSAGAVGLVVGIWVPGLGLAAAVGLTGYFVGAVLTVLRAHAYTHVPYPLLYLAPVVVAGGLIAASG
jgi:RNA polymerase sigma factor (sigma-70 family)